jgi:tRNA nucleotidyltransferase (CCA-adding enzyme)
LTIDGRLIPEDVRAVCVRLRAAGHQAHLVGGGIRDLIIGRAPTDFDVATDAHPQRVLALFGAHYAIPTGLAHGTVTVLTERVPPQAAAGDTDVGPKVTRRHVEVTTFRGEGAYVDGRRPSSVTYVPSLEEDLSRRDFTMNAIGYDPLGDVLTDPFDGRADIVKRIVRAVGDAETRFREDGLRPMRAVRQAAQLEFEIEAPTLRAISRTLDVFRKVSAERIRDEMLKLLAAPRPSVGIELMRETSLLAEVLPELLEGVGIAQNRFHSHDVYRHTLAVVDATTGDALTRLGALLHDIGKPRARQPRVGAPGEFTFFKHEYVGAAMTDAVCRRWKMSSADRERVVALVQHHMFFYTPEWTDGTVRRFVRRVGPDVLPALFALREGDIIGRGRAEDPETELGALRQRIVAVSGEDAAMRVGDLTIDGRDLMRILGWGPGREIGIMLDRLLERVLDEPRLNNPDDLTRLAAEMAAAPDPSPRKG